jgi:hypothetical protein
MFMLGLTDYVLVTTVNGVLNHHGKPTNFFTPAATVRIAMERALQADIPGNQRARSDIDKQAYPHLVATTVRKVYGLTGANYDQYTAFRNWQKLTLDDAVNNGDEIVLIKNTLLNINRQYIAESIARHRILPSRFDR